jgi:hypothetical protein
VAIGSEISGGCRNIFVENCTMNSPELERAIRIKTNSQRGGTIEKVFIRNLQVGEVREAVIKFDCQYENDDGKEGNYIPVVKDIHIDNVTSEKSMYALFFQGIPGEKTISGIYISDCIFNGIGKSNRMTDVGEVELKNVQINPSITGQ